MRASIIQLKNNIDPKIVWKRMNEPMTIFAPRVFVYPSKNSPTFNKLLFQLNGGIVEPQ